MATSSATATTVLNHAPPLAPISSPTILSFPSSFFPSQPLRSHFQCGLYTTLHRLTPSLHASTAVAVPAGAETATSQRHSSMLLGLFQELGFNESEASGVLLVNPEAAEAPLHWLQTRVSSLRSVGITGLMLSHLIAKRPEVLTAAEVDHFLQFVAEQLKGINPLKLKRLLISVQPNHLAGFTDKVEMLAIHGVPREKLSILLNGVNLKLFCYRETAQLESVVVLFKRFGIDWAVRRPGLLNLDLERQLLPRVGILAELGGGDDRATELLRKFAPILAYSAEHMKDHIHFWNSVGLTNEQYFRILLIYPNLFSISKERKLAPRFAFLKQCGLETEDIYKLLIKAPLYLSLSFRKNLSMKLSMLLKLGYEPETRELAVALGAVTRTSCENLQMVIELLFDVGFSNEDILVMSKKHPQLLQYNRKSLEKKVEYLTEGMGREVGELLAFPAFLGYKLDERIKHRYEAKKVVRGSGMSLNKLLSVPADRFGTKISNLRNL